MSHPFWSVTRQDFMDTDDLEIGETVVALDGQHFRLTSITPRAGPEPVFNLEVANQHVYYVSSNGLLVHNAIYLTRTAKAYPKHMTALKSYIKKAGRKAKLRAHGHHIVMKGAFKKSPEIAKALKESRAILKRAGIKDHVNDVRNLAPAINRDHGVAYAQAVLKRLKDAEKVGGKEGVLRALDQIRDQLSRGELIR